MGAEPLLMLMKRSPSPTIPGGIGVAVGATAGAAFDFTGASSTGPHDSDGPVPVRKYMTRPLPHRRTAWTSPLGISKSCGGVPANEAFMKRAQIRAGMLPPYDSFIRE